MSARRSRVSGSPRDRGAADPATAKSAVGERRAGSSPPSARRRRGRGHSFPVRGDRAQLRRRNAAAERISQPLTIAQIFAWLVSLLVAAAFLASQYRHGLRWASWWSEVADSRTFHSWLLASVGLERNILLLVAALGTLAVLSGVALYLAAERE